MWNIYKVYILLTQKIKIKIQFFYKYIDDFMIIKLYLLFKNYKDKIDRVYYKLFIYNYFQAFFKNWNQNSKSYMHSSIDIYICEGQISYIYQYNKINIFFPYTLFMLIICRIGILTT